MGARLVPKDFQVKSYFGGFAVLKQLCGDAVHAEICVSGGWFRDWKPNLERGTVTGRAVDFNRPGMDFGDPAADGEA
jgi:hypothetical protein